MSRFPRKARAASVKCVPCNAPVAETVDKEYICVKCGASPLKSNKRADGAGMAHGD